MSKIVKVAFGVPTEGHTPPESLQSLRMMCFHHGVLQERSKQEEVTYEFYDLTAGRLFTPMAREMLAERALQVGADYLLMIDDDMLAPHDLFDKLYKHDVDIVSPLAFTRNPPHLAVLYQTREGWDSVKRQNFVTTEWIRNWPRKKLVECDATGFGAVLIKTSVLKKMQKPYFMCSSGTGEDVVFCLRAKQEAGAHIFMDTATELGHIGAPIIIDTAAHEKYNDPVEQEKLYGPYRKFGVFEVCHQEMTESKEAEVLGR